MTDDELCAADETAAVNEPDPIKAAEKRGYSRGYVAGQRRVAVAENEEAREERRLEFRRQVFLAALPGLIVNGTWQTGGKTARKPSEYVSIAWYFADEALKGARL